MADSEGGELSLKLPSAHFVVKIRPEEGVVYKYPRSHERVNTPEKLKALVARQQSLAHIEGVPWVEYDEESNSLVEELVPGKAVLDMTLTPEERALVDAEVERIKCEIHRAGWERQDVTPQNIMFDRKTQTVTLIDYVKMVPIGGKT